METQKKLRTFKKKKNENNIYMYQNYIYMYISEFVGHKAVIAGNSVVLKFKINNAFKWIKLYA